MLSGFIYSVVENVLVFIWSCWEMLALLWSVLVVATVKGQGGPPDSGGAGGPPEQECVLLITSPIYVCEDEISQSYMKTDKVETIRYNESLTYVTGEVEMLKPFDPSTVLEILLSKIANGKKEAMFSMEMKLCEELAKKEESDFYTLLQYLGFPADCNIDVGMYKINNLVAEMDGLPINSGNIGDYEATLNFNKCEDDQCNEKTFEACVKLDCVIEPL